jgi:hypothetical protein
VPTGRPTGPAVPETVVLWLRGSEFRLIGAEEVIPIAVRTSAKWEDGRWHTAQGEPAMWHLEVWRGTCGEFPAPQSIEPLVFPTCLATDRASTSMGATR